MGGGSAGGAGGAGSGAGLCTLQMPLGSEVLFLHLLFLPFSPLTFTLHCLVGFKRCQQVRRVREVQYSYHHGNRNEITKTICRFVYGEDCEL